MKVIHRKAKFNIEYLLCNKDYMETTLIYDFHCAEEKESEVKLERVGLSTIFLFSTQAKHSI